MAQTRLVQTSLMTALYQGPASDSHPSHRCGMSAFSMYESSSAKENWQNLQLPPNTALRQMKPAEIMTAYFLGTSIKSQECTSSRVPELHRSRALMQ